MEPGIFFPLQQSIRLVDLADLPVETLRVNILLCAILTTMKVARSGEFLDRIEEIAPLLSGALRETDLGLESVFTQPDSTE